jgi:hypothetical protein
MKADANVRKRISRFVSWRLWLVLFSGAAINKQYESIE